ncbi:GerAB/ArcD/ProY family transporter [Vallitalea pronyensis]|uniref:GerAB/ArcD/ProY family transporter n=1 Tax=Vallitalea pronyensis TaxID=1348613 RepID=A0A8J8MNX3_9FIRM|nr:GerAB/ArcD/ProY family transporter [Vallitalea pronyensis]QUI24678.1 GerAB/ArcD/ProY family transporter [Vallitalea pronyensis]
MNQQKLSVRQVVSLIYTGTISNIIFLLFFAINRAGRASYIAAILGGLVTALLLFLVIYLTNKFPGKSLLDLLKMGYGQGIASFFIILYSLFHIITAALMLRLSISVFVKTFLLHMTPLWLLELIPIVIIGLFLYTGNIFIFASWNVLIVVIAFAAYALGTSIGIAVKFNINHLFPIFHVKLWDFLYGAFLLAAGMMETVIHSFSVVGFINDKKTSYKAYWYGTIMFITVVSSTLFVSLGILGLGIESKRVFSVVNLAQEIGIGRFIQGFEVFYLVPFLSLIYNNIGYKAYCSLIGIFTVANHRKHRLIYTIMICTSIYALVLNIPSFNVGIVYVKNFAIYIIVPFCILYLILAGIAIILIRHKRKKEATPRNHYIP